MKIIDLLNKIAKGEEVPKKIKYEKDTYIHIDNYCYYCEDTNLILSDRIFAEYSKLNDEVEVIEEDKKMANYITNLQQENKQLKDNWNKLKAYLNDKSERAVGEDEYVYDEIYNEMQELEKESDR